MKQQILNILQPFIDSGKKISNQLTIKFWKSNGLYEQILNYGIQYNLEFKSLSEIIYCIINDITIKPKCKCGNSISFFNYNKGYKSFCSRECGTTDKDKIKKGILNYTIIGGASKLFNYFKNNFEFNEIISYADRSWSNGKLYDYLGFKFIKNTIPNYYWIVNGIKHNRFNFRKDILIKNGFLLKGESEVQCMHRLGNYRLYDSGSKLYKYSIL